MIVRNDLPSLSAAPATVPDAIADAIASDIAAERLATGERLVELQLVSRFGASRGSVREALRLLEARRLVQISPHRGAVVLGMPLEAIADAFVVTAALIGVAARYVAELRRPESLAKIRGQMTDIRAMVDAGFSPPLDFANALGRFFAGLVTATENRFLRDTISSTLHYSSWEAIWSTPCDHLTLERQREVSTNIFHIAGLIESGDGDGADRAIRAFLQDSRDVAITELARRSGASIDRSRLIHLGDETAAPPTDLSIRLTALERKVAELGRTLKSG